VLDSLDAAARDGVLLTRPAFPEIRRFRSWLIEEIVSQIESPESGASWTASVVTYDGPDPAGHDVEWELSSDNADVATAAAGDDNRIVAISAAAGRLLGSAPGELRGRRLTEVIPENWRDRHVSGFTEFLLTGRSRIIGKPLRLPVLCRDRSIVEVNLIVAVEQSLQGRTVFVARLTPTALHQDHLPNSADVGRHVDPR
jgi:PAS domain S-box-containing protein